VYNDLENRGVLFDKSISKEGGHSVHRIRHISDETGRYLIQSLQKDVSQKSNVKIYKNCHLLDLIVEDGECKGLWFADTNKHRIKSMRADAIVLAAGGGANLYKYHTNSFFANAEAISIAYRAGAYVSGMEFVQFHPTKLYEKNIGHHLLITEALRGAGAVIRNQAGDEIMNGVHELKSLAPRDIVSKTMFRQMMTENADCLKLDISSVSKSQMKSDFPLLDAVCNLEGFYNKMEIPVTPAAHYFCGGIVTGLNAETNIKNLFAIGESASTGLHGANRLASNSLLELFVMGESLAKFLNNELETKAELKNIVLSVQADWNHSESDEFLIQIKEIMWKGFGIVRTHQQMMISLNGILNLLNRIDCLISEKGNLIHLVKSKNICLAALLVAESALQRRESRGCHYREDYPESAIGRPFTRPFRSHFKEYFSSIQLEEPELVNSLI
jgi:L-aspartate oxidase